MKINPRDGAEMVLIPEGPFQMGDADFDYDNPPHTVLLSSYYIYQNLVTVKQYRAFCNATHRAMPHAPSFDPSWSKGDHPIVNVSWIEAVAYCSWAGGELPTEAQWEKAARGLDGRKFPWGDDFDENKAWGLVSCAKVGQEGTCAVGKHADNPYGLSDMAGNAMQWCADWYDLEYCKSSPQNNPTGPHEGTERVCRGGCWMSEYDGFFRCALRASMLPDGFAPSQAVNVGSKPPDSIGFRCVVRADTC
jgi:formylglycine-generating enzyme required for sulfatase activity